MFEFDVLESKDFEIVKKRSKVFYNTDNVKSLSDLIKNDKGNDFMRLISDGNSTEKNISFVRFTNEPINNNNKRYYVSGKNLKESLIVFSVRKMIVPDWVDMKDEYILPNIQIDWNNQFVIDSIVYSLFNNSSYQKSSDEFKNEFFWMSVNQMKELADENEYDNLYNDARTASNRHVYNLLFGEERIYDRLSPDAKLVLDKATEMVKESVKMRKFMADDENHLDSWDAGYAQLKLVWKKYMEKDFKEFRQLYKNLENRMRPLVYELGFLMK